MNKKYENIFKCSKCCNRFSFQIAMIDNQKYFPPLCSQCLINKINPFEEIVNILSSFTIFKSTQKLSQSFSVNKELIESLKKDSSNGIYIYCLENNKIIKSLEKYTWPPNLSIFINGTKLLTENKFNVDISAMIKEENIVDVYFGTTNSSNLINIVVVESLHILIQNIYLSNDFTISKCKNKTINILTEQMISKEKFSPFCPFTTKLIKTPAKSLNCQHFQCFDLYTFLKINKCRKKFKCPICTELCFIDDLFVDKYFGNIINNLNIKYSDNMIEYDFYIDNKGDYSAEEIKKKEDFNYDDSFDKESKAFIENLNYSPKNNFDYSADEINLMKLSKLLPTIKNLNITKACKNQKTTSEQFNDVCQDLFQKNKKLIEIISSNLNADNHKEFIIHIDKLITLKHKKICENSKNLLALELISSFSFYAFAVDNYSTSIEIIFGELIGYYSEIKNYDEYETVDFLSLITNFFPLFDPCYNYLIQTNKKDKFTTNEKSLDFFTVLLETFKSTKFSAKIMKNLFPILQSTKEKEIKKLFLIPLCDRVYKSKKEITNFMKYIKE